VRLAMKIVADPRFRCHAAERGGYGGSTDDEAGCRQGQVIARGTRRSERFDGFLANEGQN
jgi:hypothetical protein